MMAQKDVIEWDEGAFCKACGKLRSENKRMIYKLEVFCTNLKCPDFARGIWVDRAIYNLEATE